MSQLKIRTQPEHAHPSIQPAGPAWFGSVMGTAIGASLCDLHGLTILAWILLAVAWAFMIGHTLAYLSHCASRPGTFHDSIRNPGQATAWGMVSMGILAVGSATASLFSSPMGWLIDAVLWGPATILGLVITPWFLARIARHDTGDPTFAWALPLVAPMVSATTGANLSAHVSEGLSTPTLVIASCCWFITLAASIPVFVRVYLRGWPPVDASCSAFIPLGVVGQSTAAAHALAIAWATRGIEFSGAAEHYGVFMTLIGVFALPWAYVCLARGVLKRLSFSPGWWATTFPVGTCCLGSWAQEWHTLSAVLLALLLANIAFAGIGSLVAVVKAAR